MPYRKEALAEGRIYHVFTKSIAGYTIFNGADDYQRMYKTLLFYTAENPPCKFSQLFEGQERIDPVLRKTSSSLVSVLAFCLMPTHVHLVLRQEIPDGVSKYINIVLKSYSKYFNIKHNRKGPLWEGRFKNVRVDDEEQLLHLTRYVHLNPVSSGLVDQPEAWEFSSYGQYAGLKKSQDTPCCLEEIGEMTPETYRVFVEERIDDQRALERIKHLILEE